MKLPANGALVGPDFHFGLAPAELLQLSLWGNCARMTFGAATVNGFEENAGLLKRLRWHGAVDELSASMELETLLPFGAEFRVTRQIELWDGVGIVAFDVNAGAGGRIQSLELEPLVLAGDWQEIRLVRNPAVPGDIETFVPGPETRTIYDDRAPFFRLAAVDHAGRMLEIGTGDDWWRWDRPEANSEFRIEAGRNAITVRRRVLQLSFDENTPPTKRPYRFTWYFAWAAPHIAAPEASAEEWAAATPSSCLKAAATQRALRKRIRQADTDVALAATPSIGCVDAGHLERPDKGDLPHHDAMERARFHLWSNRQLARHGHGMCWLGTPSGMALEAALSRIPRRGCGAQITE